MLLSRQSKTLGINNRLKNIIAIPICILILLLSSSSAVLSKNNLASPDKHVKILQSNEQEIVVEYILKPHIENLLDVEGIKMKLIEIPLSGWTQESGKPQLPIDAILIGVPPGNRPVVSIIESNFDIIENQLIAPSPIYRFTEDGEAIPEYKIDREFYETFNNFYPSTVAHLGETSQIRDLITAKIILHPFQYNPVTKQLKKLIHLKLRIRFIPEMNKGRGEWQSVSDNDPLYEPIYRNLIINYDDARKWKGFEKPILNSIMTDTTGNWYSLQQNYYRIPIITDGIYRLTFNDLLSYGIDLRTMNNSTTALYHKGNSIPIFIETSDANFSNWYIEFFAQRNYGVNSSFDFYNDTSLYFLTWNDSRPQRFTNTNIPAQISSDTIRWFQETLHMEQDLNYFFGVTQNDILTTDDVPGEGWYWNDYSSGTTRDMSFTIDTVQRFTGNLAQIKVRLHGMTICSGGSCRPPSRHSAQLLINGILIGEANWNDNTEYIFTTTFSDTLLRKGSNTLRIRSKSWTSADSNITKFYLDWFQISYPRPLLVTSGVMRFKSPTIYSFKTINFIVSGISASTATIYDLTHKRRLTGQIAIDSITFIFSDTISSQRDYIIVSQSGRLTPDRLEPKTFKNLRSNTKGADYIVITHPLFCSEAERLAQHRSSFNKFRTSVIDVQDIYDEFNFGHLNPIALRQFLRYSYYYWKKPSPTFVLLFGDATWDTKQRLSGSIKKNYVPAYGNPPSDNALVSFDSLNNFIPYMLIGRLPVESPQQAVTVVDKMISYDSPPIDEWNKSFLFITGGNTASEKFIFNYWSDDLINRYVTSSPIGGQPYKVYKATDAIIDGESKPLLQSLIKNGLVFINFIGHSGGRVWGVDVGNPNNLENTQGKLPFVASVSCNVGFFSDPRSNVLSEDFVMAENRGGIAAWAGSSIGYGSVGRTLVDKFLSGISRDYARNIGLLTTLSRIHFWLINSYTTPLVIQTLQLHPLIGDPATVLAIPQKPDFKINENDIQLLTNPPTSDSTITLSITTTNLGIMAGMPIQLSIQDYYTKDNATTFKTIMLPDFSFFDTVLTTLDVKQKPGTHIITVHIDPKDSIIESKENNNIAQQSLYIYRNSICVVHPINYSIIRSNSPILTVTTPFSNDTTPLKYSFEIDTIPTFNSSWKISSPEIIPGKVFAYWQTPTLGGNKVYYWRSRTSTNLHNGAWITSSFRISNDAPGNDTITWQQSAKQQWENNSRNLISITDTGITMLRSDTTIIYTRSVGNRYNMLTEYYSVIYINTERAIGHWWQDAYSFIAAYYDPVLERRRFKGFDLLRVGSVDSMINFLDQIPNNYYVMISAVLNARQNVSEALYQRIEQLGSTSIRSVQAGHSWILVSRKGVGRIVEDHQPTGIAEYELRLGNLYKSGRGEFYSPIIGPSSKWINAEWNLTLTSSQTNGDLIIIGYRNENNFDTLTTVPASQQQINLSGVLSSTYPQIQLIARLWNTDGTTTPILTQWTVQYITPPDLAISAWTVRTTPDSIISGMQIQTFVDVYNIGMKQSDTACVRFALDDIPIPSTEIIVLPIIPGQFRAYSKSFNISGNPGIHTLSTTIIPSTKTNDLIEQNNKFSKPIFILGTSAISPVTILFDGREIKNGEFVSPEPLITLKLNNSDFLQMASIPEISIYIDGSKVDTFVFPYKQQIFTQEKITETSFQWSFKDGEHRIEVFKSNSSENTNLIASVMFRVQEQPELLHVYNYPNPFSFQTTFTFLLTGRTPPNNVRIKIYTVAGRLIQELLIPQYQLQIGLNKILWDGRDKDGDEIANGYYLYKVIMQTNDGNAQQVTERLVKLR